MADLIAQGPEPDQRWRRHLTLGESVELGRSGAQWNAPWDPNISRRHALLVWQNQQLEVCRIEGARNEIFCDGKPNSKFQITAGQHFVIGNTTFSVVEENVDLTIDAPTPASEQSFSSSFLKQLRFSDAERRMAVICQLPEIIDGASSENELHGRLTTVLLSGIRNAAETAIIECQYDQENVSGFTVKYWDRRRILGKPFQASEKLIRQAIQTKQTVLHVWSKNSRASQLQTISIDVGDWAFACPIESQGKIQQVIYVAGTQSSLSESNTPQQTATGYRDDIKFAELIASTVSKILALKELERSQSSLRQFFSPVVLEVLAGRDPEQVLAPRKTEVSVLFCDLQGFSRRSEQQSADLIGLLSRVSQALGVTTHHILSNSGVVGDFHGDAAMGFWGWPLETENYPLQACLAALGIRQAMLAAAADPSHILSDFQFGMGIAMGEAVAGKIGTSDQVKVTVFGPVVNLAARLESMTRILHAPILLDQTTANWVRQHVPQTVARVRRIARVKPYGLETPLEVSELLPPSSADNSLSDKDIANYELALGALYSGDWRQAFQLLHLVPAEDRVKDFLTVFIAQHNRTAPPNWDGVIHLGQK